MSYLEILKDPIIGRLSLIQFISYFGTWFSQVAIFSMLVSYQADSVTIAMVASMGMLPAVLLAPVIGIVIDRVPFKKLMMMLLVVEIVMTLGFTFIDSLDMVWILMILIFIRSSSASMLFSAEMTLFPQIIKGDMLKKTNEIHSIIWSLCYASGMAVGGLATYYIGFDIAFLIDASLYTVAIFILFGLHISLEKTIHTNSNYDMLKEGFIYLISHKKIMHLILIHATLGLTSFDALVTLLADFQYREIIAVPLAIGWINGTRALGLMIGPLFISNFINKENLQYLFFFQGIAIIVWAFLEFNFYISLIGIFLSGLFTTTLWSYTYMLIQEEIDPQYMGRVLSYNDMIFMLFSVTVALFIGYASKWGLSLQSITIILGLGFIGVAFYYYWFKEVYLDEK
ncbi:MAG: MFS transporter [Sulfurovum sp.]